MHIERGLLGFLSVFLALQLDWSQLGADLAQQPTLDPTTVLGGQSATGTVTLTPPAPAGGLTVQLRSSSTRASVPASITIPAGATSANFTIRTTAGGLVTTVTTTAAHGETSRTAQLSI